MLDPKDAEFPRETFEKCALVISDIDYTLLKFGHDAGIQAIGQFLGNPLAREVNEMFHVSIDGHRKSPDIPWEKRGIFHELVQRIQQMELSFADNYGLKVWSREAWILIAAEKLGIKLAYTQVTQASEMYWQGVRESSRFYTDAELFLKWLARPLVLMTASDSVLKVRDDGMLDYDPEYSLHHKQKRLLHFFGDRYPMVIGDPIDKPDPRFFERVFKTARAIKDCPLQDFLVIGDSERNDLDYPRQVGCQTLLLQR